MSFEEFESLSVGLFAALYERTGRVHPMALVQTGPVKRFGVIGLVGDVDDPKALEALRQHVQTAGVRRCSVAYTAVLDEHAEVEAATLPGNQIAVENTGDPPRAMIFVFVVEQSGLTKAIGLPILDDGSLGPGLDLTGSTDSPFLSLYEEAAAPETSDEGRVEFAMGMH